MPTTPPPFTLGSPAACLLHGDYHPMDPGCWVTALNFDLLLRLSRHDFGPQERRDAYQAAVERRMLDQHARSHLQPAPAAAA